MKLPHFKMRFPLLRCYFLLPLFLMPVSLLCAQNTLSVDEAIQITLENNYGIKIARTSADIASANKTLGNSGFLPSISASGTRTERFNETIETETEVSSSLIEDATTTITNANISLNWTIFDGLRMFATWDKLGEIENRSRDELRLEMESTVSDIILLYYNVVSLKDQLAILENSVEVSLERVKIVETELDLGSSSKFDLLQAQSDLNADRAAVLREANRLTEAKILLNEVMGRDAKTEFEVENPIQINRLLDEQTLVQNVLSENTGLAIARSEETIAQQEVKEIRGERLPELVLNSGYSFNRNESTGGFTTFFETSGLNVGLTARINLFNGFDTNRRINVAKLNVKLAQYQREELKQQLLSTFSIVYQTYLNSIDLVDLEEENLENAEETLDIALERFRLGTISAIEFRESQRTFLSAESRLIQAKFEAKQSETELLRLSGRLQDLLIN